MALAGMASCFRSRETGALDPVFLANLACQDRDWSAIRAQPVNDLHLFPHYFRNRMKGFLGPGVPFNGIDLIPCGREVLLLAAEGRETARLPWVGESEVNLYSGAP